MCVLISFLSDDILPFYIQVNLVINYDLPVKHTAEYTREFEPDYEVYLHRVGRAGRFGRKGKL